MPMSVLKKHRPRPVDLSTLIGKGTTVALLVSRRDSLRTQNRNRESNYGVWGKTDRTGTLETWQFLALRGGRTFERLAFLSRIRSPQYSKISGVYWCPLTSTGRWHRTNSSWPGGGSCNQRTLGGLTIWFPASQPAHSPELNPIERVWQFIKQQFKGEVFLTLGELRERLNEVLQQITPEEISSLSSYTFILEALFYAASY